MTENLELREWIAVNLMGLEVRKERDHNFIQERYRLEYFSRGSGRPSGQIVGMDGGDYWRELPPYELTWNDAALVVEAMRARGLRVEVVCDPEGFAAVVTKNPNQYNETGIGEAEANTAPLAICLAAKAAIEGAQ